MWQTLWLLILLYFSSSPLLRGQLQPASFRVFVLDALTGKPYPHIRVTFACDGKLWDPRQIATTGLQGFAEVPFRCEAGAGIKLDIWISDDVNGKISQCGSLASQPLERIDGPGVISDPSGDGGIWCPRKVSRKLKPIPGAVILFAKKPNWIQRYLPGG